MDREIIEEKNRRLKSLRERLEARDRRIEALESRLARAEGGSNSAGHPRREAPIFFLVGRAKSGTSWLMRILNSHPEVLCRGEGRIFGREYKREDVKEAQSRIQPSSLYRALLDAEYLNAWIERSVWSRDEDKQEHLKNLTRVAADYFLTEKLSKSGKKIVGDKTPFVGDDVVGEIAGIQPGARVIHIIRDGRDVAVSAMHHIWTHADKHGGQLEMEPEELAKREAYREDPRKVLETGEGLFTEARLRSAAESWRGQVGRARRDGPRLLGENYAEVRYEGLLARPLEEVGRLLGFLGADDSREVVERCVDLTDFERWSGGREQGREDSTALLRKGVAGDWRNTFTEEDRRIYKETAGDLLVELGYEKDHGW